MHVGVSQILETLWAMTFRSPLVSLLLEGIQALTVFPLQGMELPVSNVPMRTQAFRYLLRDGVCNPPPPVSLIPQSY